MRSGAKYKDLKNVYVIFILSFDPFDQNRMVYTVKNRCLETPEMDYDDGATTLYLYTKGTVGEQSESLRTLLNYLQNTTRENAVTPELARIQDIVEEKKLDQEVKERYMDWEEYIERERDEVRFEAEKRVKEAEQEAEKEKQRAEEEKQRAEDAEQKMAQTELRLKEVEEELIRLKEQITRNITDNED